MSCGLRRRRSWIFRILYAVILLAFGGVVGSQFFGGPRCRWQGVLLWVDGKSYVEATETLQELERKIRSELARSMPAEKKAAEAPRGPAGYVMVAAPAAADARPKLKVGQKIATGDHVRAVLLDDGTPVWLNRNTSLAYESRGELTLDRGEIYLERRFVPSHDAASRRPDDKPPVGFVVNLPNGEVVTWTSKVDLRVEDEDVPITVVRGKVLLAETPVLAGRGFVYHGDKLVAGIQPDVVQRPLAAIAWTVGASDRQRGSWPADRGSVHDPASTIHDSQGHEVPTRSGSGSASPQDWIFVVECSGDRTPQEARTEIEIVRTLVNFAEDGDRAALVVAGVRAKAIAPYRLEATPETAQRMADMIGREHLVGGLNFQRALEAVQPFITAARNPVLVHIGGGRVALGERDPGKLLLRLPGSVRTIAIAVTSGDWPSMMTAEAKRPGGRAIQIDPGEDVRGPVLELLDAMDQSTPSLAIPRAGFGIAKPTPKARSGAKEFLREAFAMLLPGNPREWIGAGDVQTWREIILAAWQWQSGQLAEADERYRRLLDHPAAARWPLVWRLAARLADEGGEFGRAIACWEKALELERAEPWRIRSLGRVRQDYGWLLDEYRKLARAAAGFPSAAPQELVLRVSAAADHWRLLDPDPAPACLAAARALADLGASEEAWEYITTPSGWRKLAEKLEKEGHKRITKHEE